MCRPLFASLRVYVQLNTISLPSTLVRAKKIERSFKERGEAGDFRTAKISLTAECGRQVAVALLCFAPFRFRS